MDFIFMLTHGDRTVEAPLDVLESIRPHGLSHIGFKDVGLPTSMIRELVTGIRRSGALSYMEIVSTEPEDCLRAAQLARDLGVDRLLGGTQVEEILSILEGSETAYFPFPGRPVGHPTRLAGAPAEVEAQCRAFSAFGCPGADVLAYRAIDADPLDVIAAARRGLGREGYLIAAGSIRSPAQIRTLAAAGANAFTVGSAVFERTFRPDSLSLADQIAAILDACSETSTAQMNENKLKN